MRVRIAVCGIQIESSTFSRHVARLEDFTVSRGSAVLEAFPLTEWAPDVEFVGILLAGAQPGGPVAAEVYEALEDEMADRLRLAGPVDGVWLHMHGGMSVAGRDSAEEAWVSRVRSVVGPGPVLSGSFDPHGNLSLELATLVDLVAFHRHAPHIDHLETAHRAVCNLVAVIRRGSRPAKALVQVPSLLPGEMTATTVEPGASVFGAQLPAIDTYGLIDAAMCVGFFWADEPRNSAAVLTTAWDPAAAVAAAEELAASLWLHQDGFQIASQRSGSWAQALDHLAEGPPRPLFISDSGDNVTAGSTGDVTYALEQTLRRVEDDGPAYTILFAGLFDPASVRAAGAAGVGSTLTLAVGAHLDDRYAASVTREWQVLDLATDAEGLVVEALLAVGSVHVRIRTLRFPFVSRDDPAMSAGSFRGPDLPSLTDYDAVVVKNGYLFPSQVERAGSEFLAITPGGTDLDWTRLRYERRQRPLHPWEAVPRPDLTARLVPSFSG